MFSLRERDEWLDPRDPHHRKDVTELEGTIRRTFDLSGVLIKQKQGYLGCSAFERDDLLHHIRPTPLAELLNSFRSLFTPLYARLLRKKHVDCQTLLLLDDDTNIAEIPVESQRWWKEARMSRRLLKDGKEALSYFRTCIASASDGEWPLYKTPFEHVFPSKNELAAEIVLTGTKHGRDSNSEDTGTQYEPGTGNLHDTKVTRSSVSQTASLMAHRVSSATAGTQVPR
jgi:hypothetical protein